MRSETMPENSERKFNLKKFRAISLAISTYEDMQLLLQHIVEGLCRTFTIHGSSILLYDETEKQLFRVRSYGLSDAYIQKGALYMKDEYEDFKKGKTVLHDNLSVDPRIQYAEANAIEGIESILSIPIKYRTAVIGLLKIYHSDQMTIDDDDLESIKVMMKQLGVVIELNGMKNVIDLIKAAMEHLPSRIIGG
jgi:transcriptional regulator with GAF, ATPase, and Fis domain